MGAARSCLAPDHATGQSFCSEVKRQRNIAESEKSVNAGLNADFCHGFPLRAMNPMERPATALGYWPRAPGSLVNLFDSIEWDDQETRTSGSGARSLTPDSQGRACKAWSMKGCWLRTPAITRVSIRSMARREPAASRVEGRYSTVADHYAARTAGRHVPACVEKPPSASCASWKPFSWRSFSWLSSWPSS